MGAGVTDLITSWYFHEDGSLISDERNGPLEKFNNSSLPVWNLEWEIIFPLGWSSRVKTLCWDVNVQITFFRYSFYSFPVCLLSARLCMSPYGMSGLSSSPTRLTHPGEINHKYGASSGRSRRGGNSMEARVDPAGPRPNPLVESNAGLWVASLPFIRLGNIWNHLPVEWKHTRVCMYVCVRECLPGMLSLCGD